MISKTVGAVCDRAYFVDFRSGKARAHRARLQLNAGRSLRLPSLGAAIEPQLATLFGSEIP